MKFLRETTSKSKRILLATTAGILLSNFHGAPAICEVKSVDDSFKQARALRKAGKFEEAIQIYDKLIEQNPYDAKAYQEKGAVMAALNQYRDAISLERKAINIDPNSHLAHIYMGMIYCNKSRNLDAYDQFSKALKLKPNSYVIHMRLGLVCNQLKRLEEADKMYSIAAKLKPHRSAPHMALSAVNAKKGDIDNAIKEAELALKLEKSAINYNNLGSIFAIINRLSEAKELLSKAIELESDFTDAYITLGRVLTLQGQYDEAKQQYEKAREISPKNKVAFMELEQLKNKSVLRILVENSKTLWIETDAGLKPQVTLRVKNVSGADLSDKDLLFMARFENLKKGSMVRARTKVKKPFKPQESIDVLLRSRGKISLPEDKEQWPEVQCTVKCRVGNVSRFEDQYILDRLMDKASASVDKKQ